MESPDDGTRGFTFFQEGNSIIIPEQKLVDYYTNMVNSNGLDPGTIDSETGIIQLSYKITSEWESLYEWLLEPVSNQ